MRDIAYISVSTISKLFGVWVFRTAGWIVAACYFLFCPRKVMISVRFYKVLFPERIILYHLYCTWRQYQNFTNVFLDRFILEDLDDISYTSEGWEYLEDAVSSNKGGLVLMSHMGNWEVAAHLLKRKGVKMLLYMGIKQKEQIERLQKESLSKSGLKVVAVTQDGGSPFDILEGIKFLKENGLVSLTGDRIWRDDQRAINVSFLGHEVLLPETPHIFALLSGAPLLIFFVFRTGKKQYHFKMYKPKYVAAESRSLRKEALHQSAQEYANMIEETLREFPFEWFHFDTFLGKKIEK